jgi:signal transduction histidine kinase
MSRLRLRDQIALATFLPLAVFAALSSALAAYALQRIPRDTILQRQTALTQVAAAGVAGNLRGSVRLLEVTAAELSEAVGLPQRQQEILAGRSGVLSVFTGGVALLDRRGTAVAVAGAQEAAIGLNYAFRSYFQLLQERLTPVYSTVLHDQPGGFNAVVIAVPVLRDGVFAGACVGEFALDRHDWARDLDLLRTPEGGVAYLVDDTGIVIYHPDTGRIGADWRGADPAELPAWSFGQQAAGAAYRASRREPAMLVTATGIPGASWGLIVEEPWAAVQAAIVPYQWAAGGLLALGAALALAALIVSVNRVTRPLAALIAEGQAVAAGQPFRPLALQGPADLRTLLRVVNQMVARLAEQQASLQRYAQDVLRGQEEERLRLSRDLHDETVQDLVALTQRVELCGDLLEEDPAAAGGELRELRSLAYHTLDGVRRLSRDLRPFVLEDLGLAASLQTLCRELGQTLPAARIGCEIVGREARLPPELELAAYRVAQEALNNVRRHAPSATRVNVALFYEEWGIQLMVEDDGPGFQLADREAAARDGHLGLIGMVERARLFGGEAQIASQPGEGTTVTLRLPRPS